MMCSTFLPLAFLIILFSKKSNLELANKNSGNIFTALVELEDLVVTKQLVIDTFETFLKKEQVRINEIRKRLDRFIEHSDKTPYEIVSNPVNAYLLIKQLTIDLDHLESLAIYSAHANNLKDSLLELKRSQKFPDTEDLTGAASALTRLQDTYALDTNAMARGELGSYCCASKLSAEDCFEIGRQMYNIGDYEHSYPWMIEALRSLAQENQQNLLPTVESSTIQDAQEFSFLNVTTEANIREHLALTKYKIDETSDGISLPQKSQVPIESYQEKSKAKYQSLCRGEQKVLQFDGIKCQYITNGNPYLLIGPVKEEILHLNPVIYIYHDVMYESEIEIIKTLSAPNLKRATVFNGTTEEIPAPAKIRVGKFSWLESKDQEVVRNVDKRVMSITGLEIQTAEDLQVLNYGLGGHYVPHCDFLQRADVDDTLKLRNGDRFATFMFYLSNVEYGGATVFPKLNLTIWPRKGSAIFWYNLHRDGTGDLLTQHSACPVLLGSKWVANKWIHERGQEFRRPCLLTRPEIKFW